tara:strand:+ start:4126 stop:4794 length:669 start_codon:yes stop_codon:yes gene_type:complete
MKKHLVIAPHLDDETFGCGGTLLRAVEEGDKAFLILVTRLYDEEQRDTDSRQATIENVVGAYSFSEFIQLPHAPATLDQVPKGQLIGELSRIVNRIKPTDVYLPFKGDVHSDHGVVFEAGIAATKSFRHPYVERTLVFETQSETDFDLAPDSMGFRPNVFIDISDFVEKKISIAENFEDEMGEHPFPRSVEALRALAIVRGASSGFKAAEAFMLLRERRVSS